MAGSEAIGPKCGFRLPTMHGLDYVALRSVNQARYKQ